MVNINARDMLNMVRMVNIHEMDMISSLSSH